MKKILALTLTILVVVFALVLSSCSNNEEPTTPETDQPVVETPTVEEVHVHDFEKEVSREASCYQVGEFKITCKTCDFVKYEAGDFQHDFTAKKVTNTILEEATVCTKCGVIEWIKNYEEIEVTAEVLQTYSARDEEGKIINFVTIKYTLESSPKIIYILGEHENLQPLMINETVADRNITIVTTEQSDVTYTEIKVTDSYSEPTVVEMTIRGTSLDDVKVVFGK